MDKNNSLDFFRWRLLELEKNLTGIPDLIAAKRNELQKLAVQRDQTLSGIKDIEINTVFEIRDQYKNEALRTAGLHRELQKNPVYTNSVSSLQGIINLIKLAEIETERLEHLFKSTRYVIQITEMKLSLFFYREGGNRWVDWIRSKFSRCSNEKE